MTKNSYQKCMDWTERNIGIGLVRLMVRALTAVTAAIYCVMAAFLLVGRDTVYPGAGGWLCDCHTVSKGGWCKTSVRNL